MRELLSGKVAIVTGASSGIGRATARLFASEGASVVLSGRRSDALHDVVDEIASAGGAAIAVPGDVTDSRTHDALVRAAENRFGGLDIAFNNAGTLGRLAPLAEIGEDEWNRTIETNLTAYFLGARCQIPLLLRRGQGVILFTGSFVGNSVGMPGMGAYGVSKAALTGLVKGITADYCAQGIRANALLPGGVDTPMAGDEKQRDWAAGLHAMKRIADADEVARAALFLASDMATFVAGTNLWVDGGNSAVKL